MMIKKNALLLVGLFMAAVLIQSCTDKIESNYKDYTDEEYELLSQRLDLPSGLHNYSTEFQEGFFVNHLGEENIQSRRSDHKATLGRVLFYDKALSINETISCASCHKQELAFADDVALSEGFDGELTKRNSLPLGNTIGFETSYGSSGGQRAQFSWDESNADIASQSEAAITSEIEMGLNMPLLVSKLKTEDHYNILFNKAYGDNNILEHRVLEAIEEFVNSIVSSKSKFDHESMEMNGDIFSDFAGFTAEENKGKELYMNNCSTCHSTDHQFTAIAVANNGLDLNYEDNGVGEHKPGNNGVFKIPFLRNITKTGPYMHDGRFATLDEVLDHYSEGIANHENLHFALKSNNGQAKKMNFSSSDKEALKAYLETLTDHEMMADVKFSDPFKQ